MLCQWPLPLCARVLNTSSALTMCLTPAITLHQPRAKIMQLIQLSIFSAWFSFSLGVSLQSLSRDTGGWFPEGVSCPCQLPFYTICHVRGTLYTQVRMQMRPNDFKYKLLCFGIIRVFDVCRKTKATESG